MEQAKLESVHLEHLPVADESMVDDELESQMVVVRQVAEKHMQCAKIKNKGAPTTFIIKVTAPVKLSWSYCSC